MSTRTTGEVPVNTIKTKAYIWNQFTAFCEEKHYELTPNLTKEEIAEMLKDWAVNMKRRDGQDYKEGVVKTVWNITANQVQEMYHDNFKIDIDPFHDVIFKVARDARDAKRRRLKKIESTRKLSWPVLTSDQGLMMANAWDENTPKGLIRKMHHVVAAALDWTHAEACRACVNYFREEVRLDGTRTGRIEYNPLYGKITDENAARIVGNKWLEPNPENANLCPIRLFKKYLSKRGPNIYTDRLFLTVNHQAWSKGTEGNVWYRNSPVGKNEIRKWIRESAEKIGLDTKYNKFTIRSLFGTLNAKRPPAIGQLGQVLVTGETAANVVKFDDDCDGDNDDACQIVEETFQGPSTSASTFARNETNETTYSVTDEDSTAEDMYQDDGDMDGDSDGEGDGEPESEVIDKKADFMDISDTHILKQALDPLRVEVNTVNTVDDQREYPSPGECELFGEYIARHLQNLPVDVALELQSGIHNLVIKTRLEYIREHPNEAPPMVKQEPLRDEEEESRSSNNETPIIQTVEDNVANPVQNRPEKRSQNLDPPSNVKRFKPDRPRTDAQKSTTSSQKPKRTDSAVFAEHITLQLEQLPEEISLQLQTDIYALITQACPKFGGQSSPHRVKIKTETIDVTPTEVIDEDCESLKV